MDTDVRSKRINIWMPGKTIQFIDKTWPEQGFKSRSSFLERAAMFYASRLKKAHIKKGLKEGYLARAKRDLDIVSEWDNTSNGLL